MANTRDLSKIKAEVCKHCQEADFMLEGPRQLFICECCQLGAVRSPRQDFMSLVTLLSMKVEVMMAVAEPRRVRGARSGDNAVRKPTSIHLAMLQGELCFAACILIWC